MNVEEKALKLIEDSLNKKCNGLECKVVKNNIDLRLEIIRLNRQIDLMADFIYKIWCDYPGSIFYKLKKVIKRAHISLFIILNKVIYKYNYINKMNSYK